jgi:peptidyl-prolyl cis-trans isomerase A (cyclophilin A)
MPAFAGMTIPCYCCRMLNRIALLLAAVAAPALTQTPSANPDLVPVEIDTSLGKIVVALDAKHVPLTTANFLRYVDAHKFDGESFYRAMPYGSGGLVQGGIRDTRKLNPPVAFESSAQTGIHNTTGAIAMAASAPGDAQSDFFIETTDIPAFDGANGFAAFGHVTEGMDVVKAILAAPVSPTEGEGVMKGEMLEPPVKILKMARVTK